MYCAVAAAERLLVRSGRHLPPNCLDSDMAHGAAYRLAATLHRPGRDRLRPIRNSVFSTYGHHRTAIRYGNPTSFFFLPYHLPAASRRLIPRQPRPLHTAESRATLLAARTARQPYPHPGPPLAKPAPLPAPTPPPPALLAQRFRVSVSLSNSIPFRGQTSFIFTFCFAQGTSSRQMQTEISVCSLRPLPT